MAGNPLAFAVGRRQERRVVHRADRPGQGATLAEAAAGDDGGGAGRLSGQQDAQAIAARRIGFRHRGK